jgi:hypothetical protein
MSAWEMRIATDKGFDPFSSKLVDNTTINSWSQGLFDKIYHSSDSRDFTPAYQAAFKKWKKELVDTDRSKWNLCFKCFEAAQKYFFIF